MKFETNLVSDVKQTGDISKNTVSLDVNNIDFIVTILSTNLYSKPIESFIRETVSNAWDSHMEAGVDDPVILELLKDPEGDFYCRIQDFGVGLSPERFNTIYRNIGSSTKRADNDQIGGFGIGRFSALAYSDVVHITSVYDGIKYIYMMYKDGNTISIDLMTSVDTDERNGVEVKMQVRDGDYNNFCNAIKSQLVYFENLYIVAPSLSVLEDGEDNNIYRYNRVHWAEIDKEYNNFSIHKYKNFWVNSLDGTEQINLLLGKVRYPLRIDALGKHYAQKVAEYPISLIFEIGDLAVTPNREEILYNQKNIETIEAKLDLALEEIADIVAKESTKNFDKLGEYIEAINEKGSVTLLKGINDYDVKLKYGTFKKNYTLNGVHYDEKNFKFMAKNLSQSNTSIYQTYELNNGKIRYTNHYISIDWLKSRFDRAFFADIGNFNNITKRYIREVFKEESIFLKYENPRKGIKRAIEKLKEDAENLANRINKGYLKPEHGGEFDMKIFKVLVNATLPNIGKIPHFTMAKVPKKWIADTKAADKAKRGKIKKVGFDWSQNVNVHELRFAYHGYDITSDSTPYKMKDLQKRHKKLTIYAAKGTDDAEKLRDLFGMFKSQVRPNMVEIAPSKVKLITHIESYVNINDFMDTKHKLFRNIATAHHLKAEYPRLKDMYNIQNLGDISRKLKGVVDVLYAHQEKYEYYLGGDPRKALAEEIYAVALESNYFNEEVRGLFEKNRKDLEAALFLLDFTNGSRIPERRINLLTDYVLARKIFRPSVKAVVKAKKETIYNLIEEDENI
jgi:hypothetical protein